MDGDVENQQVRQQGSSDRNPFPTRETSPVAVESLKTVRAGIQEAGWEGIKAQLQEENTPFAQDLLARASREGRAYTKAEVDAMRAIVAQTQQIAQRREDRAFAGSPQVAQSAPVAEAPVAQSINTPDAVVSKPEISLEDRFRNAGRALKEGFSRLFGQQPKVGQS